MSGVSSLRATRAARARSRMPPQRLPSVAGHRLDPPAAGSQRQAEIASAREPEGAAEAASQLCGLLFELRRLRTLSLQPFQPGEVAKGAEGVGLHLDERDGRLGQAAVTVDDRVPGVLPALGCAARRSSSAYSR
jgi:hypothetical protein